MSKPRRGQGLSRSEGKGAATSAPVRDGGPARSSTPSPGPAEPETAPSLLVRLIDRLPLSALAVVFVFALRRLDDFDTWWHLASGRWIAANHAVPRTDVLSFTEPNNTWLNLQWLYDLMLHAVWSVGGVNALVLVSTACFVVTFALLARHLSKNVGAVASTMLLVWVAATVNERFLIRPEMASFPLLVAVQLVLAEGRRSPSKLRWLVPLMVLWANLHSLFILGVGAIVCAVAGALIAELPLLPANWRRDSAWSPAARRELLLWGGLAVAATLANPYFADALFFPIQLMKRIDGSSAVYGSIGEFRRPFSGYFLTFALGSYQVFVFAFAGFAAVAGLLRAADAAPARGEAEVEGPRFDVAALVFAAALAWLSLLARRNVGIFAVGAVPFLGACVGIVASRLPKSWTASGSVATRFVSVAVLGAVVAICALVTSNRWYAMTGETHEFGMGTFESNFQPRAVAFFREQKLPGPTYNDMTAGGYLTWDDPSGKGVYVDGRLEVYDTPFFSAYLNNLGNLPAWRADADARGIQSVMVFHRWGNRHGLIRGLGSTGEWMLVYYDETAAIFVRAAGNAEVINAARQAFAATWRDRTEAELTGPAQTFRWQWSIDRYTGQIAYARLLETLGENAEALKWFEKAIAVGLPPDFDVDTRQRAAQYLAGSRQFAQARVHLERALAVDPKNEATRGMLKKLDEISR